MQNQLLQGTMCANFQAKRTTLTFSDQICPKRNFGVGILKNLVRMQNQLLQDIMCANFQAKRTTFTFQTKFAQKRILGSKFRSSKPGFGISTSTIPWVTIFRQNAQLWIFGLNLGKSPNYVRYFGYYNVEGVAESLNELGGGGWSWVEVKMS